jgi:ATP-dependent helicase HepA
MSAFRRPAKGGQIVRARTEPKGLGKVVDANAAGVTVEYFVSVAHRERVIYSKDELVHVPLAKQTRCYLFSEDEQRWYMGRIGERDGAEYEVNLPDRASIWLHEAHVYVRCALPPDDPTETLLVHGHETAVFHAARLRLVKSLIRQRAAARGMTGLTSSRVELFSHQVEVVRRVLQDPTQRYLLADEVGLGKTIEAGIIIRQFLLDERDGRVLVIVPPMLLDQWRRELDTKFDALRDNRVDVISSLEVDRVSVSANFGLVVIDEAHHIAAEAASEESSRFDACRRLAHESDRLLLLSATPAANHESQFLAMLHLLDPQTYRLEEVEQFRARVEKRQEIGGVLLTLTETARPFSLRLSLSNLERLFPADGLIAGYVQELRGLLDSAPADASGRAKTIRAIRTHVSETYRLHRRMLRNRRGALADAIPARSSHRVREQHDESEATSRVAELLEEWRALAAASVRDDADDSAARRGLLASFLVFVQAADGSPALLEWAARLRLGERLPDAAVATSEISSYATRLLRETPHFASEQEVLRALVEAAQAQAVDQHRIRVVTDLARAIRAGAGAAAPPKCVVFTGVTSTARLLAHQLSAVLGHRAVASHISGLAREVVEEGVQRFGTSRDCFVLVCDPSGEEGRNFQFAEHLIHYDLPWHPNRLEQRIGRVDRISRRRDLTMHVLLGPQRADALDLGWYRLLSEGFALFFSSIASLQFYVDVHLPRALGRAFHEGVGGLVALAAETRAEVSAEQEKVEEQAAIDEIDAREEGAERFFQELDDSDADFEKFELGVEGWMCKVLGFERELDSRTRGRVRYRAERRTLVPDDILHSRFSAFLGRFGAYDRTAATRSPGTAVYRLGDGLIDALAEYVAWDDRGQSFAIWREDPEWSPDEGREWVGFRFDLVVEADTDPAWEVLIRGGSTRASRQALTRRADALLPPRTDTVFVDVNLAEVTDASLLKRLRRPFSKERSASGQDHNLTKGRTSIIDEVVSSDAWERVCRDARDASLRLVRARPKFRQHNEEHVAVAARTLEIKLEQLRLRKVRSDPTDADVIALDIEGERDLGNALLRGIREPRVRIDSVGFIVVSGRYPLSQATDGSAVREHA